MQRSSSKTRWLTPGYLSVVGCGAGCATLPVVFLFALVLFATLFATLGTGGMNQSTGNAATITQNARTMAAQLRDCRGMTTPNARQNGCAGAFPRFAALAPTFPPVPLQWGRSHCGSACTAWENGSFQCVSLVLAVYALTPHPLDYAGNGNQFWGLYTTAAARARGYHTVATGSGLPLAPGDLMAWSGGAFGHVSIVLSWQPPQGSAPGQITFASANTWKPIETLPLLPNLQVDTDTSPYWAGYHVQGYIHPGWLTARSSSHAEAGTLPNSPYVAVARDAALASGLDVHIFLRMINQESGFNPLAVSSAGAIGIAQLMPAMAASLHVNPRDPTSSLYAAARLLARYLHDYGGDYARALAAYNAGPGAVTRAQRCAIWRTCLPAETQHYLQHILHEP